MSSNLDASTSSRLFQLFLLVVVLFLTVKTILQIDFILYRGF